MAKILGGTHHVQGVRHGPPKPRVYANHAGSHNMQGKIHAPPPPGGTVNRGGTFGMGVLAGKKRK
jgi:hypothetical protein